MITKTMVKEYEIQQKRVVEKKKHHNLNYSQNIFQFHKK